MQDWRCLWCRACVHATCRANFIQNCSFGETRTATVPPTCLIKHQGINSLHFTISHIPFIYEDILTYCLRSITIIQIFFSETSTWHVVDPLPGSPLVVFVNSKSGGGHGNKFLRRFKQILNPGQVFDLSHDGPTFG